MEDKEQDIWKRYEALVIRNATILAEFNRLAKIAKDRGIITVDEKTGTYTETPEKVVVEKK